jgi:hypothetical protein
MRPVIRFFATLALALLAAFGAPPRAVAKALSDQNIASGVFAENIAAHARLKRPQPLDFAAEKATCGYETASGRPKWLSRDPIGERGGLNLNAFVGNDAMNMWDLLGLYESDNLFDAIAGGGAEADRKANEHREKEFPGSRPGPQNREVCVRVCKRKCPQKGEKLYYTKTGLVGAGGSCSWNLVPKCAVGDITAGLAHNHPDAENEPPHLSDADKDAAKRGNGLPTGWPANTPVGATSNGSTSIYNPNHPVSSAGDRTTNPRTMSNDEWSRLPGGNNHTP